MKKFKLGQYQDYRSLSDVKQTPEEVQADYNSARERSLAYLHQLKQSLHEKELRLLTQLRTTIFSPASLLTDRRALLGAEREYEEYLNFHNSLFPEPQSSPAKSETKSPTPGDIFYEADLANKVVNLKINYNVIFEEKSSTEDRGFIQILSKEPYPLLVQGQLGVTYLGRNADGTLFAIVNAVSGKHEKELSNYINIPLYTTL